MITALVIGVLGVLLVLGVPVAFAMGIAGITGIFLIGDNIAITPKIFYQTFIIYELLAVPLFVLMSQILLVGKVGDHLFSVINRWVQHWPGGLGVSSVLACGFFSAVCGSSTATAATVGTTAIPAMLKRDYPKPYAFGMVAGGGTLGILIPPSIPMILYAAITSESVGKLFMAGVVPGLMLIAMFVVYTIILSYVRGNMPRVPKAPLSERAALTLQHSGAIILPVVVLGGIYAGIFTPTEAAAIGSIYSLLLCGIVYRSLRISDIVPILLTTLRITCMLMLIIGAAMLMARVFTTLQIASSIMSFIEAREIGKWTFLISVNLVWLIMGMFMEVASIMLITLPIVFPVALGLGIDPIWFAVIMVINMELATITPPVGLNLFVLMGVMNERDLGMIIRGVMPPFIIIVLGLVLVMVFPSIATWLPGLL